MSKTPLLTRLKLMLGGKSSNDTSAAPPVPASEPAVQETPVAFDYTDPRIPTASMPRIETIQKLLREIEEQAKLTGAGRDALDEARRIQAVYLPELMNSYFVIPADFRAEIFRKTGRSASFQLNERLDTMIEELKRILANFAAGQIDSFSVNLRFIDRRFQGVDPNPFG